MQTVVLSILRLNQNVKLTCVIADFWAELLLGIPSPFLRVEERKDCVPRQKGSIRQVPSEKVKAARLLEEV